MKYLMGAWVCVAVVACSDGGGARDDAQVAPDAPADGAVDAPVVDPLQSMIVVDRTQAVAGTEQITVTVTVRGLSGAPIGGVSVELAATGTSNTFSPVFSTDPAGQVTAMFSSTAAETKMLSARAEGVTFDGPSVTFTPGPLAMLGFAQQPTDVVAGAPFSPLVRVESQDAFGNPVPGATGYAILSLSANPGSTSLRGPSVVMLQNGAATFPGIHIDVAAAGYSLRVQSSISGFPGSTSSSFDVTPGIPDAASSTIVAIPSSLEANGIDTTQVTFHVGNTYGAAIASTPVSLAVSGTNNMLVPAGGMTDAHGDFRATLSSTTAETKTITGTAGPAIVTGKVHFYPASCRPMLPGEPMPVIDDWLQAIAVADLDGNGTRDAIVGFNSHVAVFRNRGNGTFDPEIDTTLPIAAAVSAIAAGDFNGDGKQDLAVAVGTTGVLTVLLGAGDGTFTAQTLPLQSSPTHLVVADVNHDSHPDVIAALASGTVQIVLGTGTGTFTTGSTVAVDASVDLAVIDANRDGNPDIVLSGNPGLSLALGAGNGTFQPPMTMPVPYGRLFTGDFNNDAKPDVAIADITDQLTVYLGSGTGAFTASTPFTYREPDNSGYTGGGGAVDLDGDGNQDLVIGGAYATTILKGSGTGAFTVLARHYARTELLAEMTGDSHLDLVSFVSHGVQVIPGTSTAAFVAAPEVFSAFDSDSQLFDTVADFNGDGRGDYVRFRTNPTFGLSALLTQADGAVIQAPSAASSGQVYDAVAADFTGDGKPDLAMITGAFQGEDLGLAIGDGTGALPAFSIQNVTNPYTTGLFGADFNQDGKQDLFMYDVNNASFAIALSTGTGFATPQLYTSPKYRSAVIHDINGDGFPDVMLAGTLTFSAEMDVYLGTSTGALKPAVTYGTSELTGAVAAGDFTGDGLPDLVFVETQPTGPLRSVFVYPNIGGGMFGAPIVTHVRLPRLLSGEYLRALDITTDGNLDIVMASTFGTVVIAGYGDGYVRQSPLFYPFGAQGGAGNPAYDPLVISDHDGDGRVDLEYMATGLFVAHNAGCAP